MAEPQLELQSLGRCIIHTFVTLADTPWDASKNSDLPCRSRISTEYQRFILWARSLGMNQVGHASLDYRVRDASVVKASLADLLGELKEHLENLASIILGDRLPLEQDAGSHQTGAAHSRDDGLSDDDSSLSSLSSIGSFKEVEFRLESIGKRLDSLYELASRIRSPRSRFQRPAKDLYNHLPEKDRTGYIEAQKEIEISRVAYVQQQKLRQDFTDEQLCELGMSKDLILTYYGSADNWLIQRTGIANSRRRQQIVYWKKHAEILGRDMAEMQLPATTDERNKTVTQFHTSENVGKELFGPNSIATSATGIKLDAPGLGDTQSVISTHSRVSTAIGPRGETLTWPPPPKTLAESKYFSCPYCCVQCPEEYLIPDKWRVHQTHDLQPYHCTYEDCTDPNRVYGLRQDWIDHENQHRRMWHCHIHGEEFETQPDYLRHLHDKKDEHKPEDGLPDMVAAVVGSSSKPHRDCPFCPTSFSDVPTMQRHVAYHLERLALYVLPDIEEQEGGELASDQTSNSQRPVENRGRQESIACDFIEEDEASFLEVLDGRTSDKTLLGRQEARDFGQNLNLMQRAEPGTTTTGDRSIIMTWLSQVPSGDVPISRASVAQINSTSKTATIAADKARVAEEPAEEPEEPPEESPEAEDAARQETPEAEAVRRHSKQTEASGATGFPECRRKHPVVGLVDWLTLPRTDFNICPDCYVAVFAKTEYRNSFQPMLRPSDRPISCDFGIGPWYRIAWLLTLKNKLPDLRLFRSVADVISATQNVPCPGDRTTTRNWLTLFNPYTRQLIYDFTICPQCARIIQALLPNLKGIFIPIDPRSEITKGLCAMRFKPKRKRFVIYFDAMETASDQAFSKNEGPDIESLSQKVERIATISECQEDTPISNGCWHTMQLLRSLSVCGECFDEVVRPLINDGNVLARSFYIKPQRLPLATCQLYSPRMREIFQKACRWNDRKYLEAKVLERMDIEAMIHDKLAKLDRSSGNDEWLGEQVDKLIQEWKKWE